MTTATTLTSRQTRTTPAAPVTGPALPRPRSMPKDHPARLIGTCNDEGDYTFLDVEISGGWNAPEQPCLTHWTADVSVNCEGDEAESTPIATMSITVVDPMAGDPRADLEALDEDAGELGEALFVGNERTPAFHAIALDDAAPVLLINTFDVEPEWRGTGLTPVMALRVLKIFANLGIRTAALHAAPIAEEMSPRERTRIGIKIEKTWAQVGFRNLDATSGFMAMSFDRFAITDSLTRVAGRNPSLRAAADLW